ncbi:MAG: hypothetical protein ACT6UU_25330, partial [Hydrogenophaga sp.]
AKLNAMRGPVRFLIPEGGVSAIDRPGQPFHDPEADRALFAALEAGFRPGPNRQLKRLPLHINDEAFADALVEAWRVIVGLTFVLVVLYLPKGMAGWAHELLERIGQRRAGGGAP